MPPLLFLKNYTKLYMHIKGKAFKKFLIHYPALNCFPRQLLLPFIALFFSFFDTTAQSTDSVSALLSHSVVIDRIIITGNNKTKTNIITRELLFREGDTIPAINISPAVNSSKENLMNIGLFNFVDIHVYQALADHVDIHIELTERWYLFPLPVFEIADRNFNEWWKKKDFNRVNFGFKIKQENFRGRDEILQAQFIFGYSQQLALFYSIPYINRKQNIGLTVALYGTRNHEIAYDSENNKIQFYKDPDKFVRNDIQGYVRITKRKGLYSYYNTIFDFRSTVTVDTVIQKNPDYFISDSPKQNHIGIAWSYRYDKRDYQPYAQQGYYYELEVKKTGFGILPHEPSLISLSAGFRKYQSLSPRLGVSGLVKGRVTQRDDAPFFNQRALGYSSDYIRGYDYYIINGKDFAYMRSNFRFTLLPTRVYELPVINTNKFKKVPVSMYLNTFYDGGYVSDNQFGYKNPLSNSWQYGYGLGFDLVTYYDLVFRFEYVWNKLGENGLFFHIGSAL
jgi:outer membrane protein assembly factor BamA